VLRLALSLFLQAMAVREAKDAVVRGVLYLVAGLLAAIFLLGAVGCAIAGLWIYVGRHLGPVGAPLICAAALILLAALVLLLTLFWRRGWLKETTKATPKQGSPSDGWSRRGVGRPRPKRDRRGVLQA